MINDDSIAFTLSFISIDYRLVLVKLIAYFLDKMEAHDIIVFISCILILNELLEFRVALITYSTFLIKVDFIYLIHEHLIVNFIFKCNFHD